MKMEYKKLRVIISGGGTGGHIFPAVSIADRLRKVNPETEILFVGAEGKMEMEKVPAAGYEIVGLPICGLQRKLSLKNIAANLKLPFKILSSIRKAGWIIDDFQPDVVIGVGGFASAPLLWAATRRKVPALIQEQNGFAGLTNKILAKRVSSICVAYEGMERFFPAEKIVISGNPIRSDIHKYGPEERLEGLKFYGLSEGCKHLFIVGGSLGSGTLNRSVMDWIEKGCPGGENVEILWQCGRYYKAGVDKFLEEHPCPKVRQTDFIARMDLAYALADVVISRSGASSISEICVAAKAAIFVPSPNVAEDHQTHNAMALVRKDAALMVKDDQARTKLLPTAFQLLGQEDRIRQIERNVARLAKPDAAQTIVDEVYKLV